MNGVINVFKERGQTSHDVVNQIRRTLNMKRVGHGGTLDPEVSGVLPIFVGKGTRLSEYVLEDDKEYIAELSLGIKTDSQDSQGEILQTSQLTVTIEDIHKVFNSYKGKITQIAPMHSAVRHKGKRLYEYAREGKVVKRKERESYIHDLRILSINEKKILFYVKCSKGTYIRTLCNDIGEDLGVYGYMSYLMRIGVGNFDINSSYSINMIKKLKEENNLAFLLPAYESIPGIPKLDIEAQYFSKLRNGMSIEVDFEIEDNIYQVFSKGEFIGIGEVRKGNNKNYLKMKKVLL